MVQGKVVRHDKGGFGNQGWPFYVVDVGEYESLKVPVDKVIKEVVEVAEEEMTDAQMKRREEIVMSMKDKTQDFKDRYGDRWKEVMYATATKQAMSEASERPVRVGDYVHAGFAVKGGAGFSGRVDKIDGNHVYVNLGKDKSVRFSNDPSSNWGDRIIKAPLKNVSLQEENTDSDYDAYFRAMLKKHGYDSPADIPDEKKDEFFNTVDAGYSAKDEEWSMPERAINSQEANEPEAAEQEPAEQEPVEQESDDEDMMSAQLDSLAQKSATLHGILKTVVLSDVPAWIQTKVATADKDITAILDYMKYEEVDPLNEAEEKDAMVPLRMQAAMVIAKSLGTVKQSGQSTELRISGGTPEAIVNQAIRVWLSGSHTPEGWALGAKMLKLAKSMGIKWDEKLVRQKLAPVTLKKLGLAEADVDSNAPSPEEKLRQRQAQEKAALELRQQREKVAQQQRDANEKIQKQQLKQAETQRTKQNKSVR
jgi:hypothetical protein